MTNLTQITTGISTATDIFQNTTIFGLQWLIALFITIIILVLISRNPKTWNYLLLPVTIVLAIMGLRPSILQYMIGAILLVVQALSLETIGNILKTTTKKVGELTFKQTGTLMKTQKHRKLDKALASNISESVGYTVPGLNLQGTAKRIHIKTLNDIQKAKNKREKRKQTKTLSQKSIQIRTNMAKTRQDLINSGMSKKQAYEEVGKIFKP